jgi:hypothetical protein
MVIPRVLFADFLGVACLFELPWSSPVEASFSFEGECMVGSGEPAADACVVGLDDCTA